MRLPKWDDVETVVCILVFNAMLVMAAVMATKIWPEFFS